RKLRTHRTARRIVWVPLFGQRAGIFVLRIARSSRAEYGGSHARQQGGPVQRLSTLFVLVRVRGRRSEARICELFVQQRISRGQRTAESSLRAADGQREAA